MNKRANSAGHWLGGGAISSAGEDREDQSWGYEGNQEFYFGRVKFQVPMGELSGDIKDVVEDRTWELEACVGAGDLRNAILCSPICSIWGGKQKKYGHRNVGKERNNRKRKPRG